MTHWQLLSSYTQIHTSCAIQNDDLYLFLHLHAVRPETY